MLPVARRDGAVAEDHCLAGQTLIGVALEARSRCEIVRSFDDADAAPVADADAAARISDGRAGPAGDVQNRFIGFCLGTVSRR